MDNFEKENIFEIGTPNDEYAQYFKGQSYLNPLVDAQDNLLFMANVTFEPGCRNNWHIHHAKTGGGQILLCIAGKGWYQEEGCDAVELKPGMVVEIKPGVKHWHGAQKDSWFSHVAIEIEGEDASSEWLEEVSDEHYSSL